MLSVFVVDQKVENTNISPDYSNWCKYNSPRVSNTISADNIISNH